MRRVWMYSALGITSLILVGCQCNEEGLTVQDADKDGHTAMTDCNDQDPDIYPGAEELCDGVDNNCDGAVDEGLAFTLYPDADGDTYGDPEQPTEVCEAEEGLVENAEDCNDGNATIYPGAEELCDDLDNDCDTDIDEDLDSTWYLDGDADGFGDPDVSISDCAPPDGYVEDQTDCNDGEPSIYPGAPEICDDDIDQDCDDEDTLCHIDGWMELDSDADISFVGWTAGDNTGTAVDLIPDLDGDGRGEILIGASGRDNPSNYSGIAYLIDFEASFPWRGLIQLKDDDTDYERWVFRPQNGGDQLGTAVAYAGDVNGDGQPDLMLGAPQNKTTSSVGSASLFLSTDLAGSPGDVSYTESSALLRAGYGSDRAGNSLHRAGDLNGDGFEDLLVGAYFSAAPYSQQGRVYVLYGCETGIGDCRASGTTYTSAYPWDSASNGMSMADIADAVLEGIKGESRLGSAVSGGGDFNGDGNDDIVVGASYDNAPKTDSGAAYIVTEFPVVTTNIESAASTKLGGESYNHWAGGSVDLAGDLNDDGYDDVLVGAEGYGSSNGGRAYLVFGGVAVPDQSLADADTTFVAEGNYYQTGHVVEGLGDLTGNGIPSFAITAHKAYGTSGQEGAGRIYIFHEAPTGEVLLTDTVNAYSGAILSGSDKGGKLGSDIAGGVDINGDGYADVLIGAAAFNSVGQAFVLLGGPL